MYIYIYIEREIYTTTQNIMTTRRETKLLKFFRIRDFSSETNQHMVFKSVEDYII